MSGPIIHIKNDIHIKEGSIINHSNESIVCSGSVSIGGPPPSANLKFQSVKVESPPQSLREQDKRQIMPNPQYLDNLHKVEFASKKTLPMPNSNKSSGGSVSFFGPHARGGKAIMNGALTWVRPLGKPNNLTPEQLKAEIREVFGLKYGNGFEAYSVEYAGGLIELKNDEIFIRKWPSEIIQDQSYIELSVSEKLLPLKLAEEQVFVIESVEPTEILCLTTDALKQEILDKLNVREMPSIKIIKYMGGIFELLCGEIIIHKVHPNIIFADDLT